MARAIVCINEWLRIGRSRYTVEHDGASNPVIHIAHTNTNRNGSAGSLNLSSNFSVNIRWRCGAISNPFAARSATSFWPCDTTTVMSVVAISSICDATHGRSADGNESCS